jgi:thioredoxin-related protein
MHSGYAGVGREARRGLRQTATTARRLAAILAWLPAALSAAPGSLTPAQDLVRDARELRARKLPLLVLYSQSDCQWCERARREYLVPMQNDGAYRDRVLLRQIDLDSDAALTDFAGRRTTHREFAKGERARVTPTVAFYGPDGERLSEPIVGLRIPDFYQAYLDRAIDEGGARLRSGK